MYHYCFLVLLLCYNVICDDCVTYTFEENENDNFTNTYGICHGMRMWNIGKFASLDIDSPHRLSTRFLQPQSALSCVSSFKFLVESSATLEVNVYMEPTTTMDQVTVLVFQSMDGGADPTVANAVLSPLDANFTPGWHTMRLTIIGTGRYEGYITFLGMASESSILLIDSFRYIAPSFDNDLCIIYKDDLPEEEITFEPAATTTTEIGTPSTTEAYGDFTSTVATTPSSTEAIVDFTPTVATTPSSTEAIVDFTPTVATTPSSTEAIVDSTTTVANTPSSTEAIVDSTFTAATTPSSTEAIVESTIPVSTTPSTTIADTTASLYPDENTTISAITTTSTTVNVTSSTTSIPSTTSEETSTTTNKTIDNTAATTDSTSAIVTTTSTTNITQSTTPSKPSSTTKVTVPATIADTTTSTTTTEKVTTTTTTTVTTKPTTTVTQPPSTSQRPNLSISLLLLKINKFFR